MVGQGHHCPKALGAPIAILAGLAGAVFAFTPALAGDGDLWTRDTLTGDWGGLRTQLSDAGIDWSLTYTGEVFGNISGGLMRGSAYEDLIVFDMDADLEKLAGWKGAKAHIALFQIDDGGRDINDLVGAISDPSNIDALPTFRLDTLYLEQAFGDWGSVRVGQLAADEEFLISDTSAYLINGTFGWPNFVADNLPGGGPGYPLAAPAVRLELDPTEKIKALGAVFAGNPAGDCPPSQDPQRCDYHGTTFSLTGGALLIGAVQYRPKPKTEGGEDGPPESVFRLGGWYHTAEFQDLGNPSRELDGNWGVFGIMDQTVWHNDTTDLTFFLRVAAMPEDRNPVSFYVDGGVGIAGPFAARPDDAIAFGFAYSEISGDLAAMDKATRRRTGLNVPIENGETALELTYIAQVTPWLSLQPDVQYIVNPGGNVANPDGDPTKAVEDAFLIGVRTDITF